MEYLLEVKNINKSFGGIKALNDASLKIMPGEIHCLVGENGAGKSTLGKIIAGIYAPDSGSILIDGTQYQRLTPQKARELRINMVTQELNLMPELTIAENIHMFANESYRKGMFLDRKLIKKQTEALFESFNLEGFPPANTILGRLTVGQQQIVEIMRSISRNNRILIFDEPTTALSLIEVEQLFILMRHLKQTGVSMVIVTHRLKEIFEIGDLTTVLCDGKVVEERIPNSDLDDFSLVKLMTGREMKDFFGVKENLELGESILEVSNLSDYNFVQNVSFSVRKHEIVGLAGLVGAGRTEIAETIFGVRKRAAGSVTVHGRQPKNNSIKNAVESGIVLIPEDRKTKGLCINLPVSSNINQVNMNLKRGFIVYEGQFKSSAQAIVDKLKIKIKSLRQKVNDLSGGNQQKVLLSKWLAQDAEVFILDEATRGIDVGTKVEIYELIRELARDGKAVLMISSEIQELIAICDRILVINEGRIVDEFAATDATEQMILEKAILGKETKSYGSC